MHTSVTGFGPRQVPPPLLWLAAYRRAAREGVCVYGSCTLSVVSTIHMLTKYIIGAYAPVEQRAKPSDSAWLDQNASMEVAYGSSVRVWDLQGVAEQRKVCRGCRE